LYKIDDVNHIFSKKADVFSYFNKSIAEVMRLPWRQRPIGKTQPIENHAGNSFSGTDIFLLIFWYARVNHFDDFQIPDNAGNNTQMVNTFDFNSFQCLVFVPLSVLIMMVQRGYIQFF